jgi:hypothetical protein
MYKRKGKMSFLMTFTAFLAIIPIFLVTCLVEPYILLANAQKEGGLRPPRAFLEDTGNNTGSAISDPTMSSSSVVLSDRLMKLIADQFKIMANQNRMMADQLYSMATQMEMMVNSTGTDTMSSSSTATEMRMIANQLATIADQSDSMAMDVDIMANSTGPLN